MKKILFTSLLACFALCDALAATSITSPTVSGHWTLAGSPYNIYNSILIPSGQSLAIDPGVNVIFHGAYDISVSGILYAVGSSVSPITFDVNDTSGWHIDTSYLHPGGWVGINFAGYTSGTPDTSTLSYCNFHHLKYGAIGVYRSLHVSNCDFSYNWGPIFTLYGASTGTHEVNNCNFSNNHVTHGGLLSMMNAPSSWYLHDNDLHDNLIDHMGCIVGCSNSTMLFSKNNVHHNVANVFADTTEDIKVIDIESFSMTQCNAVLSENKIYENTTILTPPIFCSFAVVDLYRNYIANNHHVSAAKCAHAFGGGGMFLMGNGDYNNSIIGGGVNSIYTVRNNVIANNYSSLYGGGIYVYNGKILIANNTIINNKAPRGGGIDLFMIDTVTVCIKNNILSGNINENPFCGVSSVNLTSLSKTDIRYDHNWSANTFSIDLNIAPTIGGSVTILGDTISNVVSTSAGLVAPTLTSNYTESALAADFSLQAGSPCIDTGIDSAVTPGCVDYLGNDRIYGSKVDIGAFEYGSSAVTPGPAVLLDTIFKYCCNTIIRPMALPLATKGNVPVERSMNIYPNPATNILFVSTPDATGAVVINDVTGNQVISRTVNGTLTSFDVHSQARGFYYATWTNDHDVKITRQIVLE